MELALEDMGKPIGVADYQLIVPKEKLQKVLTDEIKAFSEEKEKRFNARVTNEFLTFRSSLFTYEHDRETTEKCCRCLRQAMGRQGI